MTSEARGIIFNGTLAILKYNVSHDQIEDVKVTINIFGTLLNDLNRKQSQLSFSTDGQSSMKIYLFTGGRTYTSEQLFS